MDKYFIGGIQHACFTLSGELELIWFNRLGCNLIYHLVILPPLCRVSTRICHGTEDDAIIFALVSINSIEGRL